MTTVVVDTTYLPKVTLSVASSGRISAIIEVSGLLPTRETTAEERAAGITSLDPPTVSVWPRSQARRTHRALIDAAWVAVSASATSTLGSYGTPGALMMLYMRTVFAVRRALRLADQDI